jgi:hypothetical protein
MKPYWFRNGFVTAYAVLFRVIKNAARSIALSGGVIDLSIKFGGSVFSFDASSRSSPANILKHVMAGVRFLISEMEIRVTFSLNVFLKYGLHS